jgi:hypothetical protein
MPPPSGSGTAGHSRNAHGPSRKGGGGSGAAAAAAGAVPAPNSKGKKGGGGGGGKGRRSEGTLDAKPPPPPPPPKVGDYCCVYLEQCSDYFRPRIFDDRLGGWHPAKILQVEKSADTAPSSQGGAPAAGTPATSYHLTVSSEFFPGRKKFRYPSEHNLVMLMEPSNEDYASLSLRDDPDNIIFQAQPEMLYPGDLVLARYQAGDRWHRGRVVAVYEDYAPASDVDGEEGNGNGNGKNYLPEDDKLGAEAASPPPMAASAAGAVVGGSAEGGDNNAVAGAAGEPSREDANGEAPVANADGPRRYVCSIAYDGGGDNGRATYEINVPFRDGSHEDPGIGSDDDFPKAKPYVYLAQRGRDDVRWLQLELERMYECHELLPLRPDQQVADRDRRGGGDNRDVLPLAAQQLVPFLASDATTTIAVDAAPGNGGGNARLSLEFLYFKYDDVVRCVFEMAAKRHGTSLLEIEWPTQPRIQKSGGSRKRKKR